MTLLGHPSKPFIFKGREIKFTILFSNLLKLQRFSIINNLFVFSKVLWTVRELSPYLSTLKVSIPIPFMLENSIIFLANSKDR